MAATSRVAGWRKEASPIHRRKVFNRIAANTVWNLPGNCQLERVTVYNNSANTQAAITIGSSAAGSQYSGGVSRTTNTTGTLLATVVQIDRADVPLYIESAAWQTSGRGVHLVLEYREYPPSDSKAGLY